jgi:hypothetical protein
MKNDCLPVSAFRQRPALRTGAFVSHTGAAALRTETVETQVTTPTLTHRTKSTGTELIARATSPTKTATSKSRSTAFKPALWATPTAAHRAEPILPESPQRRTITKRLRAKAGTTLELPAWTGIALWLLAHRLWTGAGAIHALRTKRAFAVRADARRFATRRRGVGVRFARRKVLLWTLLVFRSRGAGTLRCVFGLGAERRDRDGQRDGAGDEFHVVHPFWLFLVQATIGRICRPTI